jgi:hypothetical protein
MPGARNRPRPTPSSRCPSEPQAPPPVSRSSTRDDQTSLSLPVRTRTKSERVAEERPEPCRPLVVAARLNTDPTPPDSRRTARTPLPLRVPRLDVFLTGLYRTEWSETMKPDLDGMAETIDRDRAITSMRAAKARCREKFKTPTPPAPPSPVPVLGCPSGRPLGEAPQCNTMQRRGRAPRHAQGKQWTPTNTLSSLPG